MDAVVHGHEDRGVANEKRGHGDNVPLGLRFDRLVRAEQPPRLRRAMERVKTLVIVNYHRPNTVDEASASLRRPDAVILAGGTVVNADPRCGPGRRGRPPGARHRRNRACQTVCASVRSPRCRTLSRVELVPDLIRDLAHREAPNTVRNAATIGGTIGARDPESQLLTGSWHSVHRCRCPP